MEIIVILHTLQGDVRTAYPASHAMAARLLALSYLETGKSFTIIHE